MTATAAGTRRRSTFERMYGIGVGIKGVDGVVELVAGLLLWLAPGVVHAILQGSAAEANEGYTRLSAVAADAFSRADLWVAVQSAAGIIVFLLIHGAVKITTVVCLLKRWLRAYPWALAALIALTVVQLADVVVAPSLGKVLLTLVDVAIVALVLREYAILRREAGRRPLREVLLHRGRRSPAH